MKDVEWFYPPIVQSAIAGIANSEFCQKMIDFQAGMVTLGGLSIDKLTKIATKKMVKRGRKEILLPDKESEVENWCQNQISLKKINYNQKIAANVRIVNLDKTSEIWFQILQSHIDFFEINAHCRQEEIIDIGGGQKLSQNVSNLEKLLEKIEYAFPSLQFGIKIRGYVVSNLKGFVNVLERTRCKYIHVDAMLPGVNSADLKLIKDFVETTDIPIIGNNQIRSITDVEKMLSIGVKAVSIARPLIDNPEFMNQLTQKFIEEY